MSGYVECPETLCASNPDEYLCSADSTSRTSESGRRTALRHKSLATGELPAPRVTTIDGRHWKCAE
jgi:hypothetical protein